MVVNYFTKWLYSTVNVLQVSYSVVYARAAFSISNFLQSNAILQVSASFCGTCKKRQLKHCEYDVYYAKRLDSKLLYCKCILHRCWFLCCMQEALFTYLTFYKVMQYILQVSASFYVTCKKRWLKQCAYGGRLRDDSW